MRAFNLFYKGMVKAGIHLILKSGVTFNLTLTVMKFQVAEHCY